MRNLTFIFLLLTLTSCGLFKRVFVEKQKSSSSTVTESKTKSDSTTKKTDKTVIIETEKADTTVKTKAEKFETEKAIDLIDLVDGLTVIDTGLVTISQKYDTLTKRLKTSVFVKPQKFDFKFEKSKTTYTNTTEETSKKSESQNKQATKTENKNVTRKREPAKMGILLIIAIFVVLVGGGLAWYYLRKPKKVKDKIEDIIT